MYEVILGEIIICIIALYGLFTYNKVILTNRLLQAEAKLKSRIANFERNYGEIEADTKGVVSGAMGDMGIDGLIDSLGIPSVFKPIAKGFVDNLLKNPEKLKGLAKTLGVKLPDEGNKNEIGLL